jgi:LuxR family transcriptional regulator/LuxR family quorum-sensing system transcriptional regulator CciR
MRLGVFIETCLAVEDEASLFRELSGFAANLGAELASYHVIVENLKHLNLEQGFHYHTFPQAWVDRYTQRNYFEIDPIIAACMTVREPFHWYDVGAIVKLSPEQRAYLDDMRAYGLIDGLAVPVYSNVGTAAYFGIGSMKRALALNPAEEREVMFACHQVHNRFLELRGGGSSPSNALSKRETEVLQWVARGRTNAEIARDLDISEHTVDTLLKRSFLKLAVTDRVSAVLKAVGLGAIKI